jgi:hypothetical protein
VPLFALSVAPSGSDDTGSVSADQLRAEVVRVNAHLERDR